jgi:RNA-directed DNA polymerase
MSSGSYFPGAGAGGGDTEGSWVGVRVFGVPNTSSKTAAAMLPEEKLEPIFHPDRYGYRPGRSAHDALAFRDNTTHDITE